MNSVAVSIVFSHDRSIARDNSLDTLPCKVNNLMRENIPSQLPAIHHSFHLSNAWNLCLTGGRILHTPAVPIATGLLWG